MRTDNTLRQCSRCGATLDDPASREKGQGPICSNKDTHLYAKTIPANFATAVAFALAIKPELLALECQELWINTLDKFLKKTERVQKANVDNALILCGQDFRDLVKVCDYLCSFAHPNRNQVKTHIITLVRALGYVGLAGVLEGKASTSPAKIWYENDRIYMEGLSNTDGWRTMRRIPGATLPKYRGDKTPYSVPAREFEAFKIAVMTHWPMYDGENWDTIEEKYKAATKTQASVTPAAIASGTLSNNDENVAMVLFRQRSEDFTLSFKWLKDRNMNSLVEALKTVPVKERRYDQNTKCWSFDLKHMDTVRRHCGGVFEETEIAVIKTDEITPPAPEQKRYAKWRNRGSGYRGYRRY